jgi:hypothetical protein
MINPPDRVDFDNNPEPPTDLLSPSFFTVPVEMEKNIRNYFTLSGRIRREFVG